MTYEIIISVWDKDAEVEVAGYSWTGRAGDVPPVEIDDEGLAIVVAEELSVTGIHDLAVLRLAEQAMEEDTPDG